MAQLQMYSMAHEARPTVGVAATILEGLCYNNKCVVISFPAKLSCSCDFTAARDNLSAGLIVAGWDKEAGGTVYNIPLGGGLFQGPWAIGGESLSSCFGLESLVLGSGSLSMQSSKDETSDHLLREARGLRNSVDGSPLLPPFTGSFIILKSRFWISVHLWIL